VVIRRQLKRRYVVAFFQKLPCLIGMEACASSHHSSDRLGEKWRIHVAQRLTVGVTHDDTVALLRRTSGGKRRSGIC
jgi:hypothetical protein